MAYSRFSYADVYVFMSTSGHLECCGCILDDQWAFDSTQAMVDHLAEHRAAGHNVPAGLEDSLWEDDRENWVDYARCDVEGCDKRVTCGSPADGGYVSCCSVAHAQTLGGFTNWPPTRSDRGAADTRWLNLGALLVGLGCGSYLWPPLAWALVGLLAYLLLAVPFAIGVGLGMRGGRRHG